MNTKIVAQRGPTRQSVHIRSGRGLTVFRRMWGGVCWPGFPDPGAVCIVGELEPERENVEWGQIILLDQATGRTIDQLLQNTIALKDLFCATRFYVGGRTQRGLDGNFQEGKWPNSVQSGPGR